MPHKKFYKENAEKQIEGSEKRISEMEKFLEKIKNNNLPKKALIEELERVMEEERENIKKNKEFLNSLIP